MRNSLGSLFRHRRSDAARALFARFQKVAQKLGYTVRGQRWKLIEFMSVFEAELSITHDFATKGLR